MRTLFLIALSSISMTTMADSPSPIGLKQTVLETKSATGLNRLKSNINFKDFIRPLDDDMRTQDYPTQVMRMTVNLEGKHLSCDALDKEADKRTSAVDEDEDDGFIFTIKTFCQSNDMGRTAISYSIDGFFDPLTDAAITKIEDIRAKYNGTDFFGIPWAMESAQGVAAAITFEIGNRNYPKEKVLHLSFQYNQSIYFNNYYDMASTFVKEMKSNFMNNDADTVLSFINKWLVPSSADELMSNLSKSNFIQVYPALMFVMEKEPRVYFPEATMNYVHICLQYPSKKCIG